MSSYEADAEFPLSQAEVSDNPPSSVHPAAQLITDCHPLKLIMCLYIITELVFPERSCTLTCYCCTFSDMPSLRSCVAFYTITPNLFALTQRGPNWIQRVFTTENDILGTILCENTTLSWHICATSQNILSPTIAFNNVMFRKI